MTTSAVRHFVNTMVDTAEDIAIFERGQPDQETRERLDRLGVTLLDELSLTMGHAMAARIVAIFCAAVMGEKHEREALAAMNR